MNTDCGHYDKDKNDCGVLNRKDCRSCTFYATKSELKARGENARKLLREKSPEEQSRIADKYYNGQMPWITGARKGGTRNE